MEKSINEKEQCVQTDVKCRFFAQYLGQTFENGIGGKSFLCPIDLEHMKKNVLSAKLVLKSISEITKEDAIQVAKIVHQIYSDNWEVKKVVDSSIHIELKGSVNDIYHVSIGFRECSINANHHFLKTEDDAAKSFKVNIGQVNMSSSKPIGYVYATDFLRSKGYAMPFMEYSVNNLIDLDWLRLS